MLHLRQKILNILAALMLHLAVFVLGAVVPLHAQDLKFKQITNDDGLSQNAVFAILQDEQGFMWFGTKDGLNRYDGYDFKVFQHNPFDSSSLSDNHITKLYEDSRGLLWVGTFNAGLNVYDREADVFHRFKLVQEHKGTSYGEITAITEDPDGNMFIGTLEGLFKLSHLGGDFQSFNVETVDIKSSPYIMDVQLDSAGILWVGTAQGLSRYKIASGTSQDYPLKTKHPDAPATFDSDGIHSIVISRKGDMWLGTYSGLVKYNRKTNQYKFFPHRKNLELFGWGKIHEITEDEDGLLWLASPGELMQFDPAASTYTYITNDPLNPRSLSYNNVSSIYRSSTGMIWVGTSGMGINIYNPVTERFPLLERPATPGSRVVGFSISAILEENDSILWLSTEVMYRWNRNSGKMKSFEAPLDSLMNFGNTGTWAMIRSHDGLLWAASTAGLFCYNTRSGESRLYQYEQDKQGGIPQRDVFAVFEDANRDIWIMTANYLGRLENKEQGLFETYRYTDAEAPNFYMHPVIHQHPDGALWLGTRSGLYRFDPVKKSFKSFRNDPSRKQSLSNNFVKSICADPKNPEHILWIGTAGSGLNRLDLRTESFSHFTEEQGLPNNVVYGILPDNQGRLWLSTNYGLSCFNPADTSFRNYDVHDGLQSNEFNTGAYYRSKSGELFFGGINGLNYFYPDEVQDNPHLPEMVLTSLELSGEIVTHRKYPEVISSTISTAREIYLSHKNDVVSFEFAALDFTAPEKNQYAYMLENFNKDWIYSGELRSATYSNLPPGRYVFRAKGSNNDGVWNDEGLAIAVIIPPPWWQSWWAYSAYAIIFLLAMYYLRQYELSRLKVKNQLAVEKVKTDSLQHMDEVKSRFFTNISHEFRTPLTLILGEVESLSTNRRSTVAAKKLDVVHRHALRLLSLINQLLDLSKLDAGKLKLEASPGNLVSFYRSLLMSFESLAKKRNIRLNFESESNHVLVDFDSDKMQKIGSNLISNAFKFTPAGGEIGARIKLAGSAEVAVEIYDTGIGIPAERLKQVFDRFYQVNSSHTRQYEGTGIGLALTRELIELHEGSIEVESTEGEGSIFRLKFPLSRSESYEVGATDLPIVEEQLANLPEIPDSGESSSTESAKPHANFPLVLIVEDNLDLRQFLQEQLQESYRVILARNGKEGISKAQEEIPDLIITDIMMPEMDGYEFTCSIRASEKSSHIPIIMLTGKADLEDRIEALEKGADAYLTKPFSLKELQVRVEKLISQRQELRQRYSNSINIRPSEVSVLSMDQEFMQKLLDLIEENFENPEFSVKELAEGINMSLSQLNRKLNALIDQAPGQLIRSMRLQRAADLIESQAASIGEVAYQVGFNDQAYFSRAFKKQFGCSPSAYKGRKLNL